MGAGKEKKEFDRFSHEIAAYLDCELDPARESEFEAHLAECTRCSDILNQQKAFFCGLNASLGNDKGIDLPANFAKSVVANAESTVSGLRRPRERFNALFICAGLFLFALFALGAGAGDLFGQLSAGVDQIFAIGGMIGRFVYSILGGLLVIIRSFSSQFQIGFLATATVGLVFAFATLLLSRMVIRIRRA